VVTLARARHALATSMDWAAAAMPLRSAADRDDLMGRLQVAAVDVAKTRAAYERSSALSGQDTETAELEAEVST
jgi:hypothetical protein